MTDDWRLTPEKERFRGAVFVRREWYPPKPSWDHDHCEFCWKKFAEADLADPEPTVQAGYTTAGPIGRPPEEREPAYHWVCDDCFEDFREQFEFQLTV